MTKRVLVYGMTDNPGGIETYLINTMKEMNAQGVKFDFICDFSTIAHKEQILDNESKVFFFPAKSKNLLNHWKVLYTILKNHPEYSTVYFNILDAGAAVTMIVPWLMRKKIVVHSHNGETDKKKLHKLCRIPMVMMAKEYLACSKLAANFMFGPNERIQKKVVFIPNSIDIERYKYNSYIREKKRLELGFLNNQIIICHVGRLSMQKNPFGMLDIFKEVLTLNENAIFVSIGTGELKEEVEAYAMQLGIENSIKFLGKRNDVSELMQAADVFFLPSFYEGLPIVALEAQAAGLRCVLSENITREVDITGNVIFLSLNDNKKIWAKTLLDNAILPRCKVEENLKKSEFNINNFDKVVVKLKQCL